MYHSLVRRPWCRWFILNKLLSQNPTPQSPSPAPLPPSLSPSVAVPPSAAVWSMPLCRVLWFSSINYLRKKKKKITPSVRANTIYARSAPTLRLSRHRSVRTRQAGGQAQASCTAGRSCSPRGSRRAQWRRGSCWRLARSSRTHARRASRRRRRARRRLSRTTPRGGRCRVGHRRARGRRVPAVLRLGPLRGRAG